MPKRLPLPETSVSTKLSRNLRSSKTLPGTASTSTRRHVTIGYDENLSSPSSMLSTSSKGSSWEPPHWKQHLENMRQMREKRDAPVDAMGAQKLPSQNIPEKVKRYQTLISLMLSSQTRDEVTSAAVHRLQQHGLTADNISKMGEKAIADLIYPVGFYPKKAKFIKETTNILLQNYGGDIPRSVKELCALPGVGPKMAYLTMEIAWDDCVGIGVDVHVHRISNRLKWLKKPSKTPEETRTGLEEWLPRELWREINLLMVGFGQTVCKPIKPRCGECLNQKICPVGKKLKS